jgi:hypothetical protein
MDGVNNKKGAAGALIFFHAYSLRGVKMGIASIKDLKTIIFF